MGSQIGVGNTCVPESAPSLSRQGSFYGLTLDEVQTQLGDLGKPLGNMNLDELLRAMWTGEAIDNAASDPAQLAPGSSLNRRSSFSLSRGLSKKTVEEVWREIQLGKSSRNDRERNTLGEMTLEDFLAQAGVAVDNYGDPNASQHAQWTQYQMLPQEDQTRSMVSMFMPNELAHQQPISASRGIALADPVYSDTSMSPSALMATASDTQAPGRKRVGPGDGGEKTVERRQKRMIKNRESAARSRARKQAYTHELENKVSRLEEENARLRRLKEVEKVLPSTPLPEPKYQLRRTSSAPC